MEKMFYNELENTTLSSIAASLGISPQETRRHLLILQDSKLIYREGNKYKMTLLGWVATQFMVRIEELYKVLGNVQNNFIMLPCMKMTNNTKNSTGSHLHKPCMDGKCSILMAGKWCPLIYGADINYGIFKLLEKINSIITPNTGYIAGILTAEDIFDYVINQLASSLSVTNGQIQVLIVAPADLITNPKDLTRKYGIQIIQCETEFITQTIGMDILFNSSLGLAIPHIDGKVSASAFFTLIDPISMRHLIEIWNWFVKHHPQEESIPVIGVIS
jgi:hypothetical protein